MKIKLRSLQYFTLFIYLCSLSAFQRDTVFESALEIISFVSFVGATFFLYLSSGRQKLKIDRMALWYGSFIVFASLSSLWAVYSRSEVFFYIKKMLQILVVAECFSLIIVEKKDIERTLKIILASLLFAGLLLVFRVPFHAWGTKRVGTEIGLDENILGSRMAIGLMVSFYFLAQKRNRIYLATMVLFGLLVIFSGSKNAILMAIIGMCSLMLYGKKAKNVLRFMARGLGIAAILVIMIVAIFKVPVFYNVLGIRLERTLTYFFSNMQTFDHSTSERLYYTSVARALFRQHPILGVGLNNFKVYISSVYSHAAYSHSNYWEMLSCLGVVGTVVFYSFHFSLLWRFIRLLKSERSILAVLALILLILFIVFDYSCITFMDVFQYIMICLIYNYVILASNSLPALSQESSAERETVKRKAGICFVWKMPIWLEEDDGRATGIREENVSFAVFDTLIRRSVARPADLFRIMEQNDPNVPEHFAEKRVEAERAAFAKFGARMGLADIYEELLPLYGSRTNDLMALEIQYEIAGCRPVPENIDLVNLCMEHDKNVFLIADTYLPSSVIRRMLDVCGVYHYDRLYVSCEEGACKADGSLFWKVLADQEIRPSELRHIGSDRQGDITEPWRVGVHVKRGKKKDLSTVDKDLTEETAWYERTLQTCVRNCADDLGSDDARLGCETFGPLLAGFTAWLREQLRRDGIQDVYFLAGDGSVMKQAFDALEDGSFRTYSLYFPAQTMEQDHEALLAHLRACGMQGKVALVDTGRQVGVQNTLENLITETGLDIQVKGYYVGLDADTENMQAAGYLYERDKGKETLEKLSPVMAIFDTVFRAQHGSVRRIAMRDGQPVPELDDYEYASDESRICDEIAILRAYQAGAVELVREMNEAFPGGVPQIPGEASILSLLRMGTNPTLQEAELWGDFRVFDKGKVTLMARPRGVGSYLLHPGQLKRDYAASPWKIGFLRRLVRLPLAYNKVAKRHARNG